MQNLREVVGETLLQRQKTDWSKLRGWLLKRSASKWSMAGTQQKILELTHKVIEAGPHESPPYPRSWNFPAHQRSPEILHSCTLDGRMAKPSERSLCPPLLSLLVGRQQRHKNRNKCNRGVLPAERLPDTFPHDTVLHLKRSEHSYQLLTLSQKSQLSTIPNLHFFHTYIIQLSIKNETWSLVL